MFEIPWSRNYGFVSADKLVVYNSGEFGNADIGNKTIDRNFFPIRQSRI
jgi:hypothetical protein